MVCYCLDVRPDSRVGKICANKCVSLLVAVIQVILWSASLMGYIFQPGEISQVKSMHSAEIAFAVILSITCTAFSVLLLLGIIKGRNGFIKAYLIYIVTVLVITILLILVNLFMQPQKVGFWGFFSAILGFLLNCLFFFVIKNYYLSVTCPPRNVNHV